MDPLTRDNWLDPQSIPRSLHQVESLLGTTPISAGDGARTARVLREEPAGVDFSDFCDRTRTDALLVVHGESIVLERYFGAMEPSARHIVMSVSKSVCGMVAGVLAASGELDLAATTASYVPELADGPFGTATVADLLNMTAVHHYDMDHTDPDSEVAAEDRAAGWRSARPGDPVGSRAFLQQIKSSGVGAHGRDFQYSSATTEVLSWVLERAARTPYARLVSERLWSQVGAEHDAYITVDALGTPYACAGIGMTLRDLARFGRLILDSGRGVIPADWIRQTFAGGDRAAMAGQPLLEYLPSGSYRHQWWVTGSGPIYASGLLGQYLWLDPDADLIIAKFSHVPIGADQRSEHVTGFQAITRALLERRVGRA